MTPDKLAAWLKEDVLLRRVIKKPTAAQRKPRSITQQQQDAEALVEVKALAETLELPLAEAVELLANDREGYVPPRSLLEEEEAGLAAATAAEEEEGTLLTKGTVDAYIAAVIELWRLQVAHGNHNTENPRGAAVRGFLEQRGRQRGRPDQETFQDRGIDGIQAGYSATEWLHIQDVLLSEAAFAPHQSLRTRVDLLFGHYYLLRGENRRKLELADLSLLDYPSSEGPTLCGCLVSLLRDGKMNKTARKEFMGSLRHKDPLLCTQGALAQLFFWRWHISGEEPPSFRRRQDWYRIKVLAGRDREQELSHAVQLRETWRIFGAAGIGSTNKTHLPRRTGAQNAETHASSLTQISQTGRWNQSMLVKAYATHLPRQFMRIVAGFSSSSGGDYFLPRATYEPPSMLQKRLWPWIEEWETRFEARARRQRWAEGGLDNDDLAADGFINLLRRLRIVLLQDLAILQPRYPSLPFFAHAPFYGPDWDDFALTVRSSVASGEPPSLLLQRALPEISSVLESSRDAIIQNNNRLMSGIERRLEERLDSVQKCLDTLLQGRAPISPVECTRQPAATETPATEALAATEATGAPAFAALSKVFTIKDVWKEWKDGFAGRPAIRELEEKWGSRWRPGNAIRVQFCRRKIIWDEILARTARGKGEDEVIAELELLRAGRSIIYLADELKKRRRPTPQPAEARGGSEARGRGSGRRRR